jgi:hypothetical protein
MAARPQALCAVSRRSAEPVPVPSLSHVRFSCWRGALLGKHRTSYLRVCGSRLAARRPGKCGTFKLTRNVRPALFRRASDAPSVRAWAHRASTDSLDFRLEPIPDRPPRAAETEVALSQRARTVTACHGCAWRARLTEAFGVARWAAQRALWRDPLAMNGDLQVRTPPGAHFARGGLHEVRYSQRRRGR